MTATFLGSFVVFVATGFYVVFVAQLGLTGHETVDYILASGLLLNSVFFYWVEAWTSTNPEMIKKLQSGGKSEWWLRVANQIILIGLWGTIAQQSVGFFVLFYLMFYSIVLLWDYQFFKTDRNYGRKTFLEDKIVLCDLFGFAITFVLVYSVLSKHDTGLIPDLVKLDKDMVGFFAGFCSLGYLMIVVATTRLVKFNPILILLDRKVIR